MEDLEETISEAHVRATLMVLVNAWNQKMKLPDADRRGATPPLLTNDIVSNIVDSLTYLRYLREVRTVRGDVSYDIVAPSDGVKLKRFTRIQRRKNNDIFISQLSKVLNRAMFDDDALSNLLFKMHGSLLGMLSGSGDKRDSTIQLEIDDSPVNENEQIWFTFTEIVHKVDDLNKLEGHLCTYTLFDDKEIPDGLSGKVIVCAQSAGGVDHIPELMAKTINSCIKKYYHVDGQFARAADLTEVEYNLDGGIDTETNQHKIIRRKGLNRRPMKRCVIIDGSTKILDENPRKVVSDMFKRDLLPITRFKAVDISRSEGLESGTQSLDTDEAAEQANHRGGQVNAGFKRLNEERTNAHQRKTFNILVSSIRNLPGYVNALNILADKLNPKTTTLDNVPVNTIFEKVEYKEPEPDNDDYIALANAVSSLSDYIVASVSNTFSEENKPSIITSYYGFTEVRFASNTTDKPRLDNYEMAMMQILTRCKNAVAESNSDSMVRLVTSAINALNGIIAFERNVYKQLGNSLTPVTKLNLKEFHQNRVLLNKLNQFLDQPVSKVKMYRLLREDGVYKLDSDIVTLRQCIDAVNWLHDTAGNDDDEVNQSNNVSAMMRKVNDAVKILSGHKKQTKDSVSRVAHSDHSSMWDDDTSLKGDGSAISDVSIETADDAIALLSNVVKAANPDKTVENKPTHSSPVKKEPTKSPSSTVATKPTPMASKPVETQSPKEPSKPVEIIEEKEEPEDQGQLSLDDIFGV